MKIVGYVSLFLGIVLFLYEVYLLIVTVGYGKKRCAKCKGYLRKTMHYKDKYIGRFVGRFYKHYTDYVYEYTVNGKKYEIFGGFPGTKNNLNNTVDIIYQQKNPKHAYIHKITFPIQPLIMILLLPLCALFISCGIYFVL